MIPFVILLIVPFTYQQCGNIPDVRIDQCCRNVSRWNCTDRPPDVNVNVVDRKNGMAELKFNLRCTKNVTKVSLYSYETVGETCGKKDTDLLFYDNYHLHTQLEYKIKNDDDGCAPCETVATVEFSYIFTGCYYVDIVEYGMKESTGFYLETEYKKQLSGDSNATMIVLSRDNTKFIILRHEFFKTNKKHFLINIKLYDQPFYLYKTWKLYFHRNDVNTNDPKHNMNVCRVSGSNNISDPICTFISDSEVECRFVNLPKGVYKFGYVILNEPVRCNPNSIWNRVRKTGYNHCSFEDSETINVTDVVYTTEDNEDDGVSNALIFSSIACLIILVVIGVCIIIICRKNSQRGIIERTESTSPLSGNKPKIFLLYTKDCRQFMDMMEAFRTVLTIDGKFEVFDMYDKIRMADIAVNPENWIIDKLMNCKVILVLSECASIQKNYMKRNNTKIESLYIIPSSEDNYFMYTFHALERERNETYDKLYVVNLGFDQRNYEDFKYINTHTRYCVPEHLPQLISDLNSEQISLEEHRILLQETCAIKTFLNKYREYEEYFNMRPNYLDNILHVRRNLVDYTNDVVG